MKNFCFCVSLTAALLANALFAFAQEPDKSSTFPVSSAPATLLNGAMLQVDGNVANAVPILMKITGQLQMANDKTSGEYMGCFAIGEGVGHLEDERGHIRLTSIHCQDGIDHVVKGFVVGADEKAGLKGRVVHLMGAKTAAAAASELKAIASCPECQSLTSAIVHQALPVIEIDPAQKVTIWITGGYESSYTRGRAAHGRCIKSEGSLLDQVLKEGYLAQMGTMSKSCESITTEELNKLDFSRIDLSGYVNEVMHEIPEHLLKSRINVALLKAIDDPSDTNILAWMGLQEEARGKASAFANAIVRVQAKDKTSVKAQNK